MAESNIETTEATKITSRETYLEQFKKENVYGAVDDGNYKITLEA